MDEFTFSGPVWRWQARTEGWFFVSLPEEHADAVDEAVPLPAGFGSVKVEARIGATVWRTSIFPSEGTFVLPLKKAVRTAQGFGEGDTVTVHLQVVAEVTG